MKVTESSLGILKSEREKLINDFKLKATRFPEEVIEYAFLVIFWAFEYYEMLILHLCGANNRSYHFCFSAQC